MRKLLGILGMLGLGVYILSVMSFRNAEASRNSSGTYSLATSAVTSGQVIGSTLWNNTFNDLATGVTDSLDRSGRGGMLAALRGVDGTVAAPAVSFTSETGSGLFRNGAGDLRLAILGSSKGFWNAAGLGVGAANPTTSTTTPFSVTGTGPLFAVESRSGVNARLAGNSYFDGALDRYNANGFAGLLQFGGLTTADFVFYTAPSGLAAAATTFTERLKINESGVTIGSNGTAISASIRGTVSSTPANILTQACASVTVTVTGATANADCAYGVPTNVTPNLSVMCHVRVADSCVLQLCNPTTGTITPPSGTYSCRVFNP